MVSEMTTAGELIDILFRYAPKNFDYLNYCLHIEVNDMKRQLEWEVPVLDALENSNRFGGKLVLRLLHPGALLSSSSSCSLYDNVNLNQSSCDVTEVCADSPTPCERRFLWRRRAKSLSDASSRFSMSSPSPRTLISDSSVTNFGKHNSRYSHEDYELSDAFFV